jgi:hypothetical protein
MIERLPVPTPHRWRPRQSLAAHAVDSIAGVPHQAYLGELIQLK